MKEYSIGLSFFALVGGLVINYSSIYSSWLVMILLLLFAVDIISLILTSIILESFKWLNVLREFLKCFLLMTIILVSFVLDELLETGDMIKNITLLFYIGNTMTSIIGHAISVGIQMPDQIVNLIEELQKRKMISAPPINKNSDAKSDESEDANNKEK